MKRISFYEIIEETFLNQKSWNYYSGKKSKTNPMLSEKESKNFIENFIKLSGKSKNLLSEEINNIGNRATHIVSTFFIGHYIYKNTNFKDLIDNELKKNVKKWETKSEVTFSFIWFLTCLFHDLGYTIEKYEKVKYPSLKDLKDKTRDLDIVKQI